MKRVEESKSLEKKFGLIFLKVIIAAFCIVIFFYMYFINKIGSIKIAAVALIIIVTFYWIIKISISTLPINEIGITRLVLINGANDSRKEWIIHGKTSLLIGKSTNNNKVDIDLSGNENEFFVSKVHAVMNFAANNWFLEDLGSDNGVGIKKTNGSFRKRIQSDIPYKLDQGDTIYIANIKLLAK